ncbi:hypothetical protein HO133_003401 [Letharia lupina]|uniref:Uncharacterized protein n=1 Tax=Letharia lupina TaxID=560253 RepID=A0A8H6CBM5_9LECA|nr:uncharacterized protein HO133_003401 [Letharia lupina]KAF6220269.1 hypothetical protein HO133_003401 [Letharia lupina]
MASSNGKWVDTRMLKIIRRAVQDQAIRGHEREDMEQFLSIPSPAPVAANLPTSPVAQHRPPGYMEARDKGRKPCSTTAATAGPVLRLRLIDQENLYAWHDSDRLPWAELSRTAIEYRAIVDYAYWFATGKPLRISSSGTTFDCSFTTSQPLITSPPGALTTSSSPQARSPRSTQRGRLQANPGVGQAGDWSPTLTLPDAQRARDRSVGESEK